MLDELLLQDEVLGKVTLLFEDGGGEYEEDDDEGRVREYFDELAAGDAEGVELTIGALGFPMVCGGELGVLGSIEGFDLLYFDGTAADGAPLPE